MPHVVLYVPRRSIIKVVAWGTILMLAIIRMITITVMTMPMTAPLDVVERTTFFIYNLLILYRHHDELNALYGIDLNSNTFVDLAV